MESIMPVYTTLSSANVSLDKVITLSITRNLSLYGNVTLFIGKGGSLVDAKFCVEVRRLESKL